MSGFVPQHKADHDNGQTRGVLPARDDVVRSWYRKWSNCQTEAATMLTENSQSPADPHDTGDSGHPARLHINRNKTDQLQSLSLLRSSNSTVMMKTREKNAIKPNDCLPAEKTLRHDAKITNPMKPRGLQNMCRSTGDKSVERTSCLFSKTAFALRTLRMSICRKAEIVR